MATWEKIDPQLHLERISVRNFRKIRKLDVKIPAHKKIICLVGPNGGSKSALLSLVINALRGLTQESVSESYHHSLPPTTDKFNRTFSTSEIGKEGHGYVFLMDWQSTAGEHQYRLLTHKPESHNHEFVLQLCQEFEVSHHHPKWIMDEWKNNPPSHSDPIAKSVFLFRPAERFETPYYEEQEKNISLTPRLTADASCIDKRFYPIRAAAGLTEVESLILEVLLDQKMGNRKYADLAINTIIKTLRVFKISEDSFNIQPWPFRRVGLGRLYALSLLSAGELDVLVTVGNIIAQQLYLSRKFDPDGDNEILPSGWVFIDEVDAHLHPQWQRKVLPILHELFPAINFMVTTHSPFVLQSLRREQSLVVRLPDGEVFEEDFAEWCLEDVLEVVFNASSCGPDEVIGGLK